jgi:protoporphyrinogen oxidase
MTDVIVVGAGLAGLTAAYEARRAGADVVLLESEHRPGGVVVTERVAGGWVVEGGPDSFLPGDGAVASLAAELGIADRIVQQARHGSGLWTGKALQALPAGEAAALLGIQAQPEDLSAGHSSFGGGMGELVDALAATVGPSLRLRVGVSGITPARHGFRLSITGGSTLTGSAVVLALPAWRAAQLLRGLEPHAAEALAAIRYFPSVTVSLAYREEQVGAVLEGTGFVMGRDAPLHSVVALRACTYASLKFTGRAPAGHVLVRAFLSEWAEPAADAAHRALVPILRITGEPLWSRTFGWRRGIPFYAPDHPAKLTEARRRLDGLGDLILAGAGYDGAGVGACVKSGRQAGAAAARSR